MPPKKEENGIKLDTPASQTFSEFIEDCYCRLPHKAAKHYEGIINHFKSSILSNKKKTLEELGAGEVSWYIGDFLVSYCPRKIPGMTKKSLTNAVKVIKNFVLWLKNNNYLGAGFVAMCIERLHRCDDQLERAEDAFAKMAEHFPPPGGVHARHYQASTGTRPPPGFSARVVEENGERRGCFPIENIKPRKLYLANAPQKGEVMIVNVPKEVSDVCQKGWLLEATVVQDSRNWKFTEIWGIYVHGSFGGIGLWFFMEKGRFEKKDR
eukprot:gb/GECG01009918.1/.p1 GENE.gb/GECG01009918.1/~~gb/GECG01009918.1/.p1  ORF type:complete len:266 (+),score=29.89 gb/GECG01009918.1/:1-798(+)